MSTKGGGSATPEDRYKGLVCFKFFSKFIFPYILGPSQAKAAWATCRNEKWLFWPVQLPRAELRTPISSILAATRRCVSISRFSIDYSRSDSPVCHFTTISCIPSLIHAKSYSFHSMKISFITSDMLWRNFLLAILQAPYPPICGIRWTLKNWAVQNWN